jgi:hypothetical protein
MNVRASPWYEFRLHDKSVNGLFGIQIVVRQLRARPLAYTLALIGFWENDFIRL